MQNIKLIIKYYGDEARVFESSCLNEILCTCQHRHSETKCCLTPEETKNKLIEYYQQRVDMLKKQTTEEFLNDQGIYI